MKCEFLFCLFGLWYLNFHEISAQFVSPFTCQSSKSYENALTNCPDKGRQRKSSGGNVTMIVKSASRLPNRDTTGPSSLVSDPYVRFTAGDVVAESSVVPNSLNPVWGEERVNLGILTSGTLIKVEIWDHDIGLEFSDDLLVSSTMRVPFCSTFNSSTSYLDCGQPFGCSSTDSMWAMPTRKLCRESGYVPFVLDHYICSSNDAICLQLDVEIVPFQVTIDLVRKSSISSNPQITVAADKVITVPWTSTYGRPFIGDTTAIDFRDSAMYVSTLGSLMIMTNNADKSKGAYNTPSFYASVNFPAVIYVCRNELDNLNGVPKWITSQYSASNVTATTIRLNRADFGCYYMMSQGTVKNKYGGVMSGVLTFSSNTLPGHDNNNDPSYYTNNYIILAKPRVVVVDHEVIDIVYDSSLFIDNLFFHGLVWLWLMRLIAKLMKKIDFRLERMMTYLATRVLTGENKTIVASLFISYGKSPCNVVYRAYIFHARNVLYFFILTPFLLLISWGFSCVAVVRPTGLGFAVTFLGMAATLLWYAFQLWERNGWRLTPAALMAQTVAVVLFLCYIIALIFVDPAVTIYNHPLNGTALSLVFGTINLFPLMLLVFQKDRSHTFNLKLFEEKLANAARQIKAEKAEKSEETKVTAITLDPNAAKKKPVRHSANKLLHALLGNSYTINPNFPLFRFAPIVQESVDDEIDPEVEVELQDMAKGHELYYSSLLILFIYLMIGIARTKYPSLAFLNCLALLLFDFIHYNLNNGDVQWTPGKKIAVLVAGRLLIMGSGGNLWVLTYSLAYMCYSIVLINEVINNMLPMLSKRQAGKVVFAGMEDQKGTNQDIAATSEFALGLITFAFIGVLLSAALGTSSDELPVNNIEVWRSSWAVYVFGLIAICVTITGGLIMATVRAFYLEHHGLLRGWARTSYIFKKGYRIPATLAFFSEISILASGILIYGATKSASVIIFCVFVPAIVFCFGYCGNAWIKNDFELVVWPPKEVQDKLKNDGPSDLDVAFNMIENIFGNDVQVIPDDDIPESEGKTLKGFQLPALEPTGVKTDGQIKMPPLPLKSVLRRKRQNMGIKVKTPLVKDLRVREGVEDVDKFGNANDPDDFVDANDPWAQFEEKTVKVKKRAANMQVVQLRRRGWLEHPYIVYAKKVFMESKTGQLIMRKSSECFESVRARTRKYAKISMLTRRGEADVDDELDENNDTKPKGPDVNDLSIPLSERFGNMPFWTAAAAGYLTNEEYYLLLAWFGGLFLIMIMGITLAGSTSPTWYGHVFWVSIILFIHTFVVIYKYFNTYVFDPTMRQMTYFVAIAHIIFTASFWGAKLNGSIGTAAALWMLDYFFYFPAFLYIFYEGYKWMDSGFQVSVLDKDGDDDVSIPEYIEFFKAYPILLGMMILLTWQLYVWIDYLVGRITTILLLLASVGYLFARDWAINDFFLSPEMSMIGGYMINFTLFVTLLISLFSTINPIFAISVFFFTFMFRCFVRVLSRWIVMDADTMFFCSPFVFPLYSFDARVNDIVDETETGKQLLYGLLAGTVWGGLLATFLHPVHIGIAVACAFILAIAAVMATAMSFIPTQLGKYAGMLGHDTVVSSASAAISKFYERKQPLNLEMPTWDGDFFAEEVVPKTLLQKQMDRTALDIAIDIANETRALTHIRDDSNYVASQAINLMEDVEEPPWYVQYWTTFKAEMKKLFEMIPIGKANGWKRHSEGLFTFTDALAESLITGRGPYGFFGAEGTWFKLFKRAQDYPQLEFLQQPWLNTYDEYGNSSSVAVLSEPMDLLGVLNMFPDFDKALNYCYFEESRCGIHFLLLLMVVADSNMQREQVLFQKFLRENRFRLASNGISPPAAIFSSSSFSSIDIPLVAVWLSTLSEEERERFHVLKAAFSEEQKVRDEAIDNDDYQFAYDAMVLKNEREIRENELAVKLHGNIVRTQLQRIHTFAESLEGFDRKIFEIKQDTWVNDADCFVENKNRELYERFRAACMPDIDETTEYARQMMGEIEAAQQDCRVGEYGRVYQFVDSEFLPGDVSVGDSDLSELILGWRCSPGISDSVQLFEGGTDPDDIELGIFRDNWLLSALSMLAAGDGVGDGKVDDQIRNLFIGHYDINGELTFHTELGGYCVRLFKQGAWHPIVVDDLFPMVKRLRWTNENRGMAAAHSKECRELWVSLIEKAYAKFLGSYGQLSRGYVHHALQELTGCEAECIPLALASRGTGKQTLWNNMIRFRKNGYILGAGTGISKLADKEMQDMGIAFSAAYTIFSVSSIDGHKLIKLRNPPGHNDEWKGDWGDKSNLWTRRLKAKFGYVDADDHTFYMSFDDFCNVFRYLYVCKWYDPSKWFTVQYPGFWKKASDLEKTENADMTRMMMMEQGIEVVSETPKVNKKDKLIAQVDTAGGLPTNHNPGCILENNPHYSLQVHRTTDVRISVTQADSRGKASSEIQPVSIIIVKNPHHKVAMRLHKLTNENIVCRTESPKAERTVYLYTTLKPGFYIILIPAYIAGMEGNFTVSVLTNYRTKFNVVWPPRWMLKGEDKADAMLQGAAGEAKRGMDSVGKGLVRAAAVLFGGGDDNESEDGNAAGEGSRKGDKGDEAQAGGAEEGAEM